MSFVQSIGGRHGNTWYYADSVEAGFCYWMNHIGDRDHNDIKGPQALGMKAVLFVATRAHDKDRTSADAICASHAELPAVIDGLAAG